jgi:hypothetical protein
MRYLRSYKIENKNILVLQGNLNAAGNIIFQQVPVKSQTQGGQNNKSLVQMTNVDKSCPISKFKIPFLFQMN